MPTPPLPQRPPKCLPDALCSSHGQNLGQASLRAPASVLRAQAAQGIGTAWTRAPSKTFQFDRDGPFKRLGGEDYLSPFIQFGLALLRAGGEQSAWKEI